jgi:putative ABC transport system permease protein
MLTSLFSLLRTHFLRLLSMGMIFALVIIMITLVDQIISSIDQQIASQTKPIVGADMIISSSQPISGDIVDFISTKIPTDNGNIILQSVEFYTTLGQTNDPKLVQVKGIQPWYPLYGEIDIDYLTGNLNRSGRDALLGRPDIGQAKSQSLQGVYIDPQTYALINQSGSDQGRAVSTSLQLGSLNLPILGIIKKQASLGFNFLDEGRTILMLYELVAQTKLTDIGSRVQYQLQIKLTDESQWPEIKKAIEAKFDRIYNVSLAAGRVTQLAGIIDQLNQYTSLILIITVILSLTIMSIATMTMTDQIKQAIAVMRILGLTKTKIMLLCVALFGSMFLIAVGVGYGIAYILFAYISQMEIAREFLWQSWWLWKILSIAGMSFLITCRVPLRYLVDTHPLSLLKSTETTITRRDQIAGFLLFLIGSWLILFLLTKKFLFSLWVMIIFILLTFLFFSLINLLFRVLFKKFQKFRSTHFSRFDAIRQTILPGNQTALLVGSLLVSLLAYSVITSVSLSFIDRLRISSIDQPNIFVLNVRNTDIQRIESFDTGAKLYDTILARIQSINEVPLSEYLTTKFGSGREQREYTREFNTTTRSLANSPLIKGIPLTGWAVSLDENFAKGLGVYIW